MGRRRKNESIRDRVLRSIIDGKENIVDISEETGFKRKRIVYAIKSLRKKRLITKLPDLRDMRRCRYRPVVEELTLRNLIDTKTLKKLKRRGLI